MGKRDDLIAKYADDLKKQMWHDTRYGSVDKGHNWMWSLHL